RDHLQHEPSWRLLGQRADGVVRRQPEEGVGPRRGLRHEGGGTGRDLRVHRGVLQPDPASFGAGLPIPGRVRASRVALNPALATRGEVHTLPLAPPTLHTRAALPDPARGPGLWLVFLGATGQTGAATRRTGAAAAGITPALRRGGTPPRKRRVAGSTPRPAAGSRTVLLGGRSRRLQSRGTCDRVQHQ